MSDAGLVVGLQSMQPWDADPDDAPAKGRRDRDLLAGRAKKLRDRLDELFNDVTRAYEDQADRSDAIDDYWDCFNCVLNANQFYNGTAQICLPIIHDAVVARSTRFVNQLFPQSGRYVEVVSADGTVPTSLIGLVEHYLRETRFETQVLKPLCRTGDIEGQYNLYCDWAEIEREIVSRETRGPTIPAGPGGEMIEGIGEEIEDTLPTTIVEGHPAFEVLHDADVAVWPPTVDTLDDAFAAGGGCAIVRHWTKATIDKMVADGTIRRADAKDLKDAMEDEARSSRHDTKRRMAEYVGIHPRGLGATVWEVWTMLPLDDDGGYDEDGRPRLCRVFFGPARTALGAKRNPYWNDRCPLLSVPVEKTAGVFKGKSLISYVDSIQYEANDAVNEGADAATYSAAPIVRRDPALSSGPFMFGVGAIWDGPKDAIDLLVFPDLTPRAQTRVQMAMAAILQSLGVNPSMLPQQVRNHTPNQAEVAQDQAVDLLTTAEAVKVLVEGILTPAMGLVVDYDYQFRDVDLTIRQFGEMGVRAKLEQIPPLTNRSGFTFIWRGGEQVKQTMMMQQAGTAWLNVLQNPAMQQQLAREGYSLHLAPALVAQNQNIFGAYLGGQIIINDRELLTMDPETENGILHTGQHLHVHPLDEDPRHMQSHMADMQATGDPFGTKQEHMAAHIQSMQMKIAASMQQSEARAGLPPGGGGGAGAPQPGAVPGMPHAEKRPPGSIHPDSAAGAGVVQMPRRM